MSQHGDAIEVQALSRGIEIEEGGCLWTGQLRLWDNEILMGWYVADEAAMRSKGTMYFTLHPRGVSLTGRWVGLSCDGAIVTGWPAMAREGTEARPLIDELKQRRPAP